MKVYTITKSTSNFLHVPTEISSFELIKNTEHQVVYKDDGRVIRTRIDHGYWRFVFSLEEAKSEIMNEIDRKIAYLEELKHKIRIIENPE